MREGCCAAKAQTMRIRRRRGKQESTPESRRRQKRRLPELDRRIEDEVEQGKSSKGEDFKVFSKNVVLEIHWIMLRAWEKPLLATA